MNRRILCVLSVILFLNLYVEKVSAQAPGDTVSRSESYELGRLPESFDMAVDSLFNARYREYYFGKARKYIPSHPDSQSYRERLRSMHSVIPLSYNPMVQECIDMYVNKRSGLLSSMLAKSAYYFPIIEEQLEHAGLPLELKYLAIVESALNPTAVSRMGATGLWQFMLRTGKLYGLTIDSLIDERRDPVKSTQAACRYFKDMYDIYGDWILVIAAYNCGPGNINKAIRKAGGSTDFWEIFPFLPRETRSYVPFFIAAFYAMEHHKDHNIRPDMIRVPLATDTVHINSRQTFRDLSLVTGVDIDTIRRLNPQYRREIVPASGAQVLVLPASKAIAFSCFKDSIEADTTRRKLALQETDIIHKVKRGETLSHIADKYDVDVASIKEWNHLKRSSIRRGQRLKIKVMTEVPVDDATPILAQRGADPISSTASVSGTSDHAVKASEVDLSKKKESPSAPKKRYHTVRRGESLSTIAKKYPGVTVSSLRRANNLKGNMIKPGQKLLLP